VTLPAGLSRDSVLPLIQKRMHDLEKCSWETEPGGKLVVELTVSPDGKVRNAKIISSSWKNGKAEQCVLTQIGKWQFPPAGDDREARITISFLFG
jgi:TonB family protein